MATWVEEEEDVDILVVVGSIPISLQEEVVDGDTRINKPILHTMAVVVAALLRSSRGIPIKEVVVDSIEINNGVITMATIGTGSVLAMT